MRNFGVFQKFCAENDWMEFLAKDPATRSNTSVCLVVKDLSKPEVAVMLKIATASPLTSPRTATRPLACASGVCAHSRDLPPRSPTAFIRP